MPWIWYNAADSQFFLISPFLIFLLYKNYKAGLITLIILTV